MSAAREGTHVDDRAKREQALVREHLPVVWRFLRRLGLSPEDADDASQEVFLTACRKIDVIEPGREKAYLFAIAVRLASRTRRAQTSRAAKTDAEKDVDTLGSRELDAGELLDRKQARALLDEVLASMTPDLRTTFALYELEEMTMNEIATVVEAPLGTVASRLRRAREQFQEAVQRIQRGRDR